MALFGLSILIILLLFTFYFCNYHFGVNLFTLILLVVCFLYFLLAFIFAVVSLQAWIA